METKDIILIGVIVFFFAIGFLVINFIMGKVVNQLVEVPAIAEDPLAVNAFKGITKTTDKLDYVIFGVFIALMLGMLISSWFISSHPILVVVYIIVIILSVVLGAIMANVWETASQSAVFENTITAFPITNNIMLNLPIYNVIIGILGMIMLFAKSQLKRGNGGY